MPGETATFDDFDLDAQEKEDAAAAIAQINGEQPRAGGQFARRDDGGNKRTDAERAQQQTEPAKQDEPAAGETPSAGDDATPEAKGGEGEQHPEWLTDEARDLADSYGLSDADLQQFDSFEELQKLAAFHDAAAMRRGRHMLEADQQHAGQEGQGPPPRQTSQASQREELRQPPEENDDGSEAVELDEYLDPEVASVVKGLQDQIKQLQQREQDRQEAYMASLEQQEFSAFDSIVDQLDEELFGSSFEAADNAQYDNRSKLWDAFQTLRFGSGQDSLPPISKALVQRAYRVDFSDHLLKKQRAETAAAVKKRSKQRMGGTASRQQHVGEWDGDPAENPELLELYNQMERDNGSR